MGKMTVERLHELFDENEGKENLMWKGTCHDCNCDVQITATPKEDGIHIQGGSVYEPEIEKFFLKCDPCFQKDLVLRNYQSCEVYSRVVGYLRPVSQWNDGKQSEFRDRQVFDSSVGSV
jgi:anaerobic ribonucleoside-triphosphate reductase